jgi:Uma2 family endonuclease
MMTRDSRAEGDVSMAMPAEVYPKRRPGSLFNEADLESMPDDGNRYEIVDGSLHVTPPPIDDHNEVGVDLCLVLRRAAPPGWRVLYEVGIRLRTGNMIADVGVLRPDTERGVSWHDAGDLALAVEISSPSTDRYDRTTKQAVYAEAGIASYWRVEPHSDGAHVHVYELTDEGRYTHVAWIRPGSTWKASAPYPVEIDPNGWGS